MALAFENVVAQMLFSEQKGGKDCSARMRALDPKQRKVLELFKEYEIVTAKQIGVVLGFQPRTNADLCKKWVESGFLEVVDSSNKGRAYKLADYYDALVHDGTVG